MFKSYEEFTIFQGKVVSLGSYGSHFFVNDKGELFLQEKIKTGKIGIDFEPTDKKYRADYEIQTLIGFLEVINKCDKEAIVNYAYKNNIDEEFIDYFDDNVEAISDEKRRLVLGTKEVKFLDKVYEVPLWAKSLFVDEEGDVTATDCAQVCFDAYISNSYKTKVVGHIDLDDLLTKKV